MEIKKKSFHINHQRIAIPTTITLGQFARQSYDHLKTPESALSQQSEAPLADNNPAANQPINRDHLRYP